MKIGLKTNKEYLFMDIKNNIFIQSSRVIPIKEKYNDSTRYYIRIQNYIESRNKKRREISVDNFNKMNLKFVCEI